VLHLNNHPTVLHLNNHPTVLHLNNHPMVLHPNEPLMVPHLSKPPTELLSKQPTLHRHLVRRNQVCPQVLKWQVLLLLVLLVVLL
jgi:hypothetical protein